MDYLKTGSLFMDINRYDGAEIKVCGWVRTIRESKSVGFIELNDGSCLKSLQIVFSKDLTDNFEETAGISVGSAIAAAGTVVATPGGKQPVEIAASHIEIAGSSDSEYPLQKKRHSMEFLRTIAHLRPRANIFNAAYRMRSEVSFAIHSYFHGRGFICVHTPVITCSDCEGAGAMFQVTALDMKNPPLTGSGAVDYALDFFGKKAGLTVSGQLNAEAMAHAFCNVYTFGPTFRAEKSNTPRHAAEFWMLEPEMCFADLGDDMDLCEDMIKYIVRHLFERCPAELDFFNSFVDNSLITRLENIRDSKFERMTYTDAVKILENAKTGFEYPVSWGRDLQTEHERWLAEKTVGRPVFVTDYPKDIKAFYMRLGSDGRTVAAMDLLAPGIGEIAGGSQREERLDVLKSRMAEYDLSLEEYGWYLDLRRWGGVKHAGFGLGFERFLMYVTGIANIRDIIPFPRVTGSAEY